MNKLIKHAGETIGETLVAMLIVSLSTLFVAGAVVSSAKVNNTIKNEDVAFVNDIEAGYPKADSGMTLKVDDDTTDITVKLYKTKNGYYYYEK